MSAEEETSKSDRLLEEIRRFRADRQVVDVDEQTVLLVVFTCTGSLFCCQADLVKEILSTKKINPVPGCPATILGIINLRGVIESVVNLHQLLGLKTVFNPGIRARILLVETARIRTGLLVDSVEDVIAVPASAVMRTEIRQEGDAVEGEILYKGRHATLVDIEVLLRAVQSA